MLYSTRILNFESDTDRIYISVSVGLSAVSGVSAIYAETCLIWLLLGFASKVGADLGTRLTSDSHSTSQGYCGSSFTKGKGAKLLGYLSR